jgi:hypothetical protein
VKEIAVADTSTTVDGTTLSVAELASADWVMPPTDMKGIVMMPNGITAGFRGNEVLFSPPYIPYAWPIAYRQTTDFDVVGMGVTGSMLAVMTKGNPCAFTGIDPSSMSMTKGGAFPWPCVSKRSIAVTAFGVSYAAPQGLVSIGTGGPDLVTKDLYTQEEWLALKPETFNASQYAGRYVTSYEDGVVPGVRKVLIIDKTEFASLVTTDIDVDVFWGDPTTGKLYTVFTDLVNEWDAGDLLMVADWFSKEFVFPKPVNLGVAKLDADFTISPEQSAAAEAARAALEAINAAMIAAKTTKGSLNSHSLNARSLGGSLVKKLSTVVTQSVIFQLYINGAIRMSRVVTSVRPFRLPSGYQEDNAAFRVIGNVVVKSIVAADTVKNLARA